MLDDADGGWMETTEGYFLMLHCSPVGDGSGWPFSGTGGLETWPGGSVGCSDSDHPRSGHRPHIWTMQPSIVDLERETWTLFFRFLSLPFLHVSIRPSLLHPERFTVPGI